MSKIVVVVRAEIVFSGSVWVGNKIYYGEDEWGGWRAGGRGRREGEGAVVATWLFVFLIR